MPLSTKLKDNASKLDLDSAHVQVFMTRKQGFSVAMPEGSHPFPSRTRQLSSPGPMILHPQGCGKVGRRREYFKSPPQEIAGGFLYGEKCVAKSRRSVYALKYTTG
jgi:hypothetical protein